jgi:hypothetical protein
VHVVASSESCAARIPHSDKGSIRSLDEPHLAVKASHVLFFRCGATKIMFNGIRRLWRDQASAAPNFPFCSREGRNPPSFDADYRLSAFAERTVWKVQVPLITGFLAVAKSGKCGFFVRLLAPVRKMMQRSKYHSRADQIRAVSELVSA